MKGSGPRRSKVRCLLNGWNINGLNQENEASRRALNFGEPFWKRRSKGGSASRVQFASQIIATYMMPHEPSFLGCKHTIRRLDC